MSQISEVENQLRKMILNLELGPGERVSERWVEANLKASRTPVRTALQSLESEGLVCRDGLRWMVAPIEVNEVESLCFYREVLELAALKLSVAKISEEQLTLLEHLLKRDINGDQEDVMNHAGTQFHLQLASFCENKFIINGVNDALRRLTRIRWLDKAPSNPAWDDHHEIVSALRTRDFEKSIELLSMHLRETRLRLLAIINSSRLSRRAIGLNIS